MIFSNFLYFRLVFSLYILLELASGFRKQTTALHSTEQLFLAYSSQRTFDYFCGSCGSSCGVTNAVPQLTQTQAFGQRIENIIQFLVLTRPTGMSLSIKNTPAAAPF